MSFVHLSASDTKRGTGTAVATVRSKSQEHKLPRCTEADELDHLQYLFSNIICINKPGELGILLSFHFEHLVCCQASLRWFMNLKKVTWNNVQVYQSCIYTYITQNRNINMKMSL